MARFNGLVLSLFALATLVMLPPLPIGWPSCCP
jgi:hypothetical protein